MRLNQTSPLSLGLLILRAGIGLVFFIHGWQKFNESTIVGTTATFIEMGIPMADIAAPFTVYSEMVGGGLMLLGLLTRLVALIYVFIMAAAILFVHYSAGFYASQGGYEYPLLLGLVSLALVLTGAGRYSLDGLVLAARK